MLTATTKSPVLTTATHTAAEMRPVCRQRRFNHWVDDIYYEGPWEVGPLLDALTGHISKDAEQCACTFTFEGCGLILQFWSHPWSGLADIEVDGVRHSVDLFGESPAMKNVHVDGLAVGMHLVRISAAKRRDGKHPGDQIVFHEAIVYDRLTEMVVTPAGQSSATNKPARFNSIYYAPGSLAWAVRTVLYCTVFGARPANALLVGTEAGGAGLIVVAALDDLGVGALMCVDPEPNISPELWQKMGHRTALVIGSSKDGLVAAQRRTGANFDFAFVEEAALFDSAALADALEDDAIVLLHTNSGDITTIHADLIDCGALVPHSDTTGGLRLLRRRRRP